MVEPRMGGPKPLPRTGGAPTRTAAIVRRGRRFVKRRVGRRAPVLQSAAMIPAGRLVALLAGLSLASVASAQEPRPQKVFLSGENPYIALRNAPDGPAAARASFWRIHFSPVGTGHVCFVTVGEQGKPGALRVALHDNPRLVDYLVTEVLGTFDKAYVEWPFTKVGGATFGRGGDARGEHREACHAREPRDQPVRHHVSPYPRRKRRDHDQRPAGAGRVGPERLVPRVRRDLDQVARSINRARGTAGFHASAGRPAASRRGTGRGRSRRAAPAPSGPAPARTARGSRAAWADPRCRYRPGPG
jgi:hypothetical protein